MNANLIPLLALAAAAGGCALGPHYRRPALPLPAKWSEPLGAVPARMAGPAVAWWRSFHDPELDSLIARAMRANPDLRIADARVREARAEFGAAEADFGPTLAGSGTLAKEDQSHHQPLLGRLPLPAGIPFESDLYQAGFDASWEIDVFGGTRRAAEAAGAELAAAEDRGGAALVTLLGEVARDYVEVRALQRRLAVAGNNLAAQEEALGIARDRYLHGLAGELDVEQARSVLAETRSQVPSLQSALEISIHRLSILLGRPPGSLAAELARVAPIPAAPPVVPAGLPSELLTRRPDIRAAERDLAAATDRIGVAESEWFPKFSLTGAAGQESYAAGDWTSSGSGFWSFGPAVQWKILDFGRIRANVRLQTARQEEAFAAYQRTVLSALADVEDALAAYAKEQVRRGSLATAVASDRRALAISRRLYQNGLSPFINVLEAERSCDRSEDELIQSDAAVSLDLIALYKSLGGGWAPPAAGSRPART
jgi:outer membrane protein, multidrug efflux system